MPLSAGVKSQVTKESREVSSARSTPNDETSDSGFPIPKKIKTSYIVENLKANAPTTSADNSIGIGLTNVSSDEDDLTMNNKESNDRRKKQNKKLKKYQRDEFNQSKQDDSNSDNPKDANLESTRKKVSFFTKSTSKPSSSALPTVMNPIHRTSRSSKVPVFAWAPDAISPQDQASSSHGPTFSRSIPSNFPSVSSFIPPQAVSYPVSPSLLTPAMVSTALASNSSGAVPPEIQCGSRQISPSLFCPPKVPLPVDTKFFAGVPFRSPSDIERVNFGEYPALTDAVRRTINKHKESHDLTNTDRNELFEVSLNLCKVNQSLFRQLIEFSNTMRTFITGL